jgi:hypothetical protein
VDRGPATLDPHGPPRQLVEQRAIVGDEEPDPFEAAERADQRGARGAVQVVGRLVEEEHVGPRGQGGAELPALALARREGRPPRQRRRIEREALHPAERGPVACAGELLRAVGRDIDPLIDEAHGGSARLDRHRARGRGQLAGDEAEQGRLAGAVAADQPGPAGLERELEIRENGGPALVGELRPHDADDRHTRPPRETQGGRPGGRPAAKSGLRSGRASNVDRGPTVHV